MVLRKSCLPNFNRPFYARFGDLAETLYAKKLFSHYLFQGIGQTRSPRRHRVPRACAPGGRALVPVGDVGTAGEDATPLGAVWAYI